MNVKVRVSAAVFVDRDDSGPLLPAMLLRVQTQVGQVSRLWMVPDRHQSAFIVKLIEGYHSLRSKYLL